MDINVPEGTMLADVDLVGEDGNAFSVMGIVSEGLRRAGNDQSAVDNYLEQAMGGDYDHLLAVSVAFIER